MDADPELRALLERYGEFVLCREMGWTLEELSRQPAAAVREFMAFRAAEADAKAQAVEREANRRRAGMG